MQQMRNPSSVIYKCLKSHSCKFPWIIKSNAADAFNASPRDPRHLPLSETSLASYCKYLEISKWLLSIAKGAA